ncbi:unnamed protein product [Musa textilis]
MDGNAIASDYIVAKLIDMGFEFAKATEAIEVVGPSLDDAVEFILNGSCKSNNTGRAYHFLSCSTSQSFDEEYVPSHASKRMKQSNITDHLPPLCGTDKIATHNASGASFSGTGGTGRSKCRKLDQQTISNVCAASGLYSASKSAQQVPENDVNDTELVSRGNRRLQSHSLFNQEVELDWEQKIGDILKKHFGFFSLKGFQKKALEAWLANRDCLVLAATGSGRKSLCFQIPALLTSKIVIVISPLISLMHDQCLKLAKHGLSACFLGSGQPDSSVEYKAMCGMYKIVYVCPETILRLIEPLRRLAVNPGIALFAIDEVHCVSKWGHDFRPDYRRLHMLRENFNSCNLKSQQFDIPLMALTATATIPVRKDIIESLHMSKETEIILTSFFRPNLRFSVKHSRTCSVSSYAKDFKDLIRNYTVPKMTSRKGHKNISYEKKDDPENYSSGYDISAEEESSLLDSEEDEDDNICDNYKINLTEDSSSLKENQLTAEYLEDELDIPYAVDDLDVSCGEFPGTSAAENLKTPGTFELYDIQGSLEGPTIIYVPTRKETLKIAEFLCKSGVRAAAYHAKLAKTHLRHVHDEFHQGSLQVVVATIAFGMGIDKSNVRRIIHYGWPQSLEAYYQEAGRAGRDGKLADCTLYVNLSRIPTLLPSQRSDEQTKQAYKMLSDCFRYAMNTTTCRAKKLVGYFGEEFSHDGCHLCDICVAGPPKTQNMKAEAVIFLGVLKAESGHTSDGYVYDTGNKMLKGRSNLRVVISRIREQSHKFATIDRLWWQGLARILENMGYIREGDNMVHVSIRFPELTEFGLRFLHFESEKDFFTHPEADMLLAATKEDQPYSTFSEWGRGWADPEIRRQRLQGKRHRRRKGRKHSQKYNEHNPSTVRGRLAAKLSKRTKH